MTSWPSMTVIGQVSIPTLGQLKCSCAPTLPPHARGLVLRLIILCCAFVWHIHKIILAWHTVMEKSYTWCHSINHNFCDLQLKSLDANQTRTGKSVRLHTDSSYFSFHFVTETAQLIVESWEVWTYILISSLGLQYSPNEAQYTLRGS